MTEPTQSADTAAPKWAVVNGDGFVNPRRFATLAEAERAIERGYGSEDAVAMPLLIDGSGGDHADA